MIYKDTFKCFGFFKGLPYGNCNESMDDYRRTDCLLSRAAVIGHFESLDAAYTSAPTKDINTGEIFPAGLYDDGEFLFTTDFVRYYMQGKVDIPREYEEYLIKTISNIN